MTSHTTALLDHQGFQIGDQVVVRASTVKMAVGTVGTIVGFSAIADHPLVEIIRRGRFLIPALSLVRWTPKPMQEGDALTTAPPNRLEARQRVVGVATQRTLVEDSHGRHGV